MPETALKRNNVRVVGNGRQVMALAHGYGCDQNVWRFITPAFRNDFRVATGHGPHLSTPEETLAAMKPFLS